MFKSSSKQLEIIPAMATAQCHSDELETIVKLHNEGSRFSSYRYQNRQPANQEHLSQNGALVSRLLLLSLESGSLRAPEVIVPGSCTPHDHRSTAWRPNQRTLTPCFSLCPVSLVRCFVTPAPDCRWLKPLEVEPLVNAGRKRVGGWGIRGGFVGACGVGAELADTETNIILLYDIKHYKLPNKHTNIHLPLIQHSHQNHPSGLWCHRLKVSGKKLLCVY